MGNLFNKRYKITAIFILFYVVSVLGFSLYRYLQIKESYMQRIDMTLKDAANSAIFIVGREFHDTCDRKSPPDSFTDRGNLLKLSELAKMHEVEYVYTLIMDEGKVYFTSSSATEEELKYQEGLSHFGDPYEEATDTLKASFQSGKVTYEVSRDQWGHFRSILIPYTTQKGRRFVAGADIEISHIEALAARSVMRSLGEGLFFLLILLPFLLFVYRFFREENRLLKNLVEDKTAELTGLNETLEQRVTREIENSRKKDMILNQQTRLAAMGEMIGNIAHQWRQPITALSLIIQDVYEAHRNGELDDAYMQRSVNDSHRLTQMMSTTIDDFKNFFSPNKTRENFSILPAVERACNIMRASLETNQITLTVEKNEATDMEIFGFSNEYSQVIMNLLNNAKDAIVGNGVQYGRITITIASEGERSVVTVSDNGGGIPRDIMAKIFDPYFTTKHKSQGTGIGLYMSKQIVENSMGGMLMVKNGDQGAEFKIVI